MVRIQLETGYLNVKEGTVFPLNFGVAEIRDLSKRSGTFSKSITLVGDDNNNQLLNHYYDVNVQAGTFDLDALTKCAVIQNDVPIVEDAYLQLVSVNKVQRGQGYEEEVEYIVLVKDAQVDFFTKIDNAMLEDLDFTDFDHVYNSTNVAASFAHTVADGYVYPVCANPSNVYPLNSMFPAIYAKQYFDRIHSTNGVSYEWATLSDDQFDKAVIPFNGDKPKYDYSDYKVQATKTSFVPTLGSAITTWTEVTDAQNLFTPATGVYEPPFYFGAGQSVDVKATLTFDLNLVNGTGANAYLVDMQNSGFTRKITYVAKVVALKNGVANMGAEIAPNVVGIDFQTTDNPLANGDTTLLSGTYTVNFPLSNLLPTDDITFTVDIVELPTGIVSWRDANSVNANAVTITNELDISSMRIECNLAVNTFGFGQTVEMNDFIPRKIKQKDFIKWVLFRWNLFAELDNTNPNKIIYKTRDTYYDDGAEKDWTLKLAKEREQQLQFLPELSTKKLILSDKDDTDEYNTAYLGAINETYGQVEFTFDNEYIKGIERKETIFSPTPMIATTFNAIVPSINGASPKTNIRFLLHNGTATCDTYYIYDYGTTGATQTTYPIVHHFNDPLNPTFDLNFGTCDYYFYQGITLTNNTMFNKYWRRTIGQINSGKMLTAYFNLNEGDIQTLRLSDKIRIDNSWWNINRVMDYNANDLGLTKVELMSVDTEIDLPPFRTKPVRPVTPSLGFDSFAQLTQKFYTDANVNYSKGSVEVKGYGNVVSPNLKGLVIGDNGVITEDGIIIDEVNTTPFTGEVVVHQKLFAIGSWDMDATATKTVTLDIDDLKLISVSPVIVTDNLNEATGLERGGYWSYTSPTITLVRDAAGAFDNTGYDDTSVNRGTILIHYID